MTKVADYDFNTDTYWYETGREDEGDEGIHLTAVANFHGKAHPGNYYDPPEGRDIEMAFFTDDGKHLTLEEAMDQYGVKQPSIDALEERFRDMDAEQEESFYEDFDEDED